MVSCTVSSIWLSLANGSSSCVDAAVKDDLFPVGGFQPARLHVRRFGLDRVQDLNAAVHQVVDQPVYASAGMVAGISPL